VPFPAITFKHSYNVASARARREYRRDRCGRWRRIMSPVMGRVCRARCQESGHDRLSVPTHHSIAPSGCRVAWAKIQCFYAVILATSAVKFDYSPCRVSPLRPLSSFHPVCPPIIMAPACLDTETSMFGRKIGRLHLTMHQIIKATIRLDFSGQCIISGTYPGNNSVLEFPGFDILRYFSGNYQ